MNVSIVIPAHNAAQTIADTLESVCAQTCSTWEAVVVDDGSTDRTAEIVSEFAARDRRIRMIQQPNGGEAAARNAGIGQALHEWLLFLDADDWIAPAHLEKLTEQLLADPSLDAVHCGYARVAADGSMVVEQYRPPTGDSFSTLARRAVFPIHACIVRKSLVEEVGTFDTSLRTSPDWDLWQRVARTGANFGSVPEVLAFYRMSPHGASLDARQLFQDGMRVLRQGHSPDARVPRPHPDHASGLANDPIPAQEFYLLSWCAGLLLGSGQDAQPLLQLTGGDHFPELYPEAVAQCIFESAPLPTCRTPQAWEKLWPATQRRLADFLVALEAHAMAPGLARAATTSLKHMVLAASPMGSLMLERLGEMMAAFDQERTNWQRLAEEREQSLKEQQAERSKWQQLAEQREQSLEERKGLLDQIRESHALLEAERSNWQRLAEKHETRLEKERGEFREQLAASMAERESLQRSYEHRVGDVLLNRWRLRTPALWVAGQQAAISQQRSLSRLRTEGRGSHEGKIKVLATACDVFPIYSQTFVYQELTELSQNGFEIRFVYSKLDSRDRLAEPFADLWQAKRCLPLNDRVHEHDYAHYRRRFPSKVAALVDRLASASGMTEAAVVRHGNFLQAFSFTRMVEAYQPAYLHSYFFYDRSLMALVAGYLLDIPRGVSCYADHLLKDYELKVVPLHLELCDIVIATSERIKRELLDIAPDADASRILVKPNGISAERFPQVARSEPTGGAPFRLVTVCRIEPKKGLLDLVEAVSLLRERGLQVEAHIVGTVDEWSQASRDYKATLDARISELGLWGKVHLEGRQMLDGVLRFLGMAHLFVAPFVETLTGDKDGIPTALLEAMATGLPVVATDAGSIPEVIDDGIDGLIVPQDDPNALATAIAELIETVERRSALGVHGARKVRERFDASTGERVFHDRLRSLLAVRGGSDRASR